MAEKQFDVCIIGSGPGGYVAAIRASQQGLKTALIEAENIGGVCLNWGCIPTKALLKTAELKHLMENAEAFGLKAKGIEVNWKSVIERSRKISQKLTGGIRHLMKKNKVEVFEGWGRIEKTGTTHHTLTVEKNKKSIATLKSRFVILATGAKPKIIPHLKPDGKHIWTSKEAMISEKCPKSLLVIGSGAIGVEFASFYNDMGCEVTVVEIQDRILPVEDAEISLLARKAFETAKIRILTSAQVSSLTVKGGKVNATIKQEGKEKTLSFEKALVAVGIEGNTENLGLEKTKVKVEKGQIQTNEWGETAEPRLYAIGDVRGAPWLAHKASHEGIIAINHLKGEKNLHALNKTLIPGCTYSRPQIASLGLTEAQAKEQGLKIKVGRFSYLANGKALAIGESEGLIKTIYDEKTGELLGAHMIGAEVTEMIQGYVIAKTAELTEADLMQTVFPHPTLSEMMHESVLQAFDRAIHI